LADFGERVQIVSRAGSKITVRSERKEEFEIEEEFTTNDLDKMATVMAAQREKRQAGAIAAKALQRATIEAASTPSEMPKNEQQVGLRKIRMRQLEAAIAAAEKRKAQLHTEHSQSINSWGNYIRDQSGNTHIVKKAGITGGSAPDSAENKARAREAQRLDQQIAAMRAELRQIEKALASAE
jgi:hypothetical protein